MKNYRALFVFLSISLAASVARAQQPCTPASTDPLSTLIGAVPDDKTDAPQPSRNWKETYLSVRGREVTKAEEDVDLAAAARRVAYLQIAFALAAGRSPMRAFHADKHWTGPVKIQVRDDLPSYARYGIFSQPGASFDGVIRFSNSGGIPQMDKDDIVRGLALKVKAPEGEQDFLAISADGIFAKNGYQFVAVANALLEGIKKGKRVTGEDGRTYVKPSQLAVARALDDELLKIHPKAPPLLSFNLLDPIRHAAIKLEVQKERARIMTSLGFEGVGHSLDPDLSLATIQYWSNAPVKVGPYAARYTFVPVSDREPEFDDKDIPPRYLGNELRQRLQSEPVKFTLVFQFFVNEDDTPIEDSSVSWDDDAVSVPVATITIPRGTAEDTRVENLRFSPWNHTGFRPLGNTMRMRDPVYRISAEGRDAAPAHDE